MNEKLVIILITLPVVLFSLHSIFFPEQAVRLTGINTLRKKPTKSAVKRYRLSGYITLVVCVAIIVLGLLGKVNVGAR